ncbi:tRNA (adenosine(37)-N6)-threonylcarbamoyltransferase complex transferase subunit TsaD [Candidatus Saccharibacteria bacterium]|nr:tRNA (adenosine(37)-N6)-threonylcarbamoyltransferase complex transferase subunit TsaD [Candidatus Saccharibacteria bacterium]
MRILGIETSCDETAAAVVQDGTHILSNVVNSQIDIHKVYGGVVPEVAARSHIEVINAVIDEAVQSAAARLDFGQSALPAKFLAASPKKLQAKTLGLEGENSTEQLRSDPWDQIDAIAVTYAPGLIGSLLVGTLAARTLAILKNKPLYPIHHIESHIYANFLKTKPDNQPDFGQSALSRSDKTLGLEGENQADHLASSLPTFPILALVVSGGHTQLIMLKNHGDFEIIGSTRDDAVGEVFDKVAKIIGLPYPGGPEISKAALKGDRNKYKLPKSKLDSPYDFSFSGLKTATLRAVQKAVGKPISFPSHQLAELLTDPQRYDFAASFEKTAVDTLVDKTLLAYDHFKPKTVVIAGGVSANQYLRQQLKQRLPINIDYAPIDLCTDNAAMVAAAGFWHTKKDEPTDPYDLDVNPSLRLV